MSTTARFNRAALTPCCAFGRHVITAFRIHFSTFSHLKKLPTLAAVTSTKCKTAERRCNLVQICRATALECTALQCFALFCFCCFFVVWLEIATISKKYLANINFQHRMDAAASAPVSPSIPPHRGGGSGGGGGVGGGFWPQTQRAAAATPSEHWKRQRPPPAARCISRFAANKHPLRCLSGL